MYTWNLSHYPFFEGGIGEVMSLSQVICHQDGLAILVGKFSSNYSSAVMGYQPFSGYSGGKISTSKTKSAGICGKDIKRVKIVIDGKIVEEVVKFKYQ
jgi:hypothetical protein